MKSTFIVDFADLTGNGIEPIIRIYIGNDNTDDKLLRALFQSTDKLNVKYDTPEKTSGEELPNSYIVLSKS